MVEKLKIIAIAAAAALGLSAAARADTILQSGTTIDGWTVTFPAGIGLVVDSNETTASTLALEKFPEFVGSAGLPITFTQSGAAAGSIDFVDEQITNLSNSAWTGFQYTLTNVASGMGAGAASFDVNPSIPSPFAPPVGYTGVSINSSTSISYTGSQAAGSTSNWGFGADGDLVINAEPSVAGMIPQDFNFVEQPMTSNTPPPPPPPAIPLPAAAWQSIFGLLALGLIGSIRKARKSA